MIDSTTTCSSSIEQNMLYVVLDTNVLINHLKFLEEFKDQDIKGCGRPVLVIPWVVMQELDSLKDSKNIRHDTDYNINRKARAAVKFLHLCFESRHPRVKGQSMTEGSTKLPTVNIESNDDRVLQCCILYQQKVDAEVILFTNDKNLCNKAISSDVQAFTKESLLKGIRELFGVDIVSPVRIKKSNTNANQSKTSTQDTKSAKLNTAQTKEQKLKEFADDILCKLKARLREALSVVLETEMKNAFGDIWLSIVLIKPPWTMKDLIDCYNKHWIAVFGFNCKKKR
ncbi:transcriptional protein SWT1-like [Saccoglossus kowalevskii]